jgi:malate dehydrogenase (quinone)
VPSFGQKLNGNTALTQQVCDNTAATLLLTKPPVINMGDQTVAPTQAKPRTESGKQDMAL